MRPRSTRLCPTPTSRSLIHPNLKLLMSILRTTTQRAVCGHGLSSLVYACSYASFVVFDYGLTRLFSGSFRSMRYLRLRQRLGRTYRPCLRYRLLGALSEICVTCTQIFQVYYQEVMLRHMSPSDMYAPYFLTS